MANATNMPDNSSWKKKFMEEFACTCGGSHCGNVYKEDIMDDLQDFIEEAIAEAEMRARSEERNSFFKKLDVIVEQAKSQERERVLKQALGYLEHFMRGAHQFRNQIDREKDKSRWERYNTEHSVWLNAMEQVESLLPPNPTK